MKLLWKSEPLQLPDMTRLEDDEEFEDHKKLAEKREELADKRNRDYHLLIKLLHKFDYTNTRMYTSQLHPSTFLPLKWQFRDAPKSMGMFIPDIRQYLAENGITDRARQDAFIDAKEEPYHTIRMLVDKEAAETHGKMAHATRQSAYGRNNPGFYFGESAEICSHDLGDMRFFLHPRTKAPVPLFHVRRAVVVNRSPDLGPSQGNLWTDPELSSRIVEALALGDHPSYGYLGTTHTHPVLGQASPSDLDLESHDHSTPWGYSQIIRPGMNIDQFTRRITREWGDIREWINDNWRGTSNNTASKLWRYLKNQDPRTAGTRPQDLLHAQGLDDLGMPLRRDSRVFVIRHPSRRFMWDSDEPSAHPEYATNYAREADFTTIHPNHVIYLGAKDANLGASQFIVLPDAFHKEMGTERPSSPERPPSPERPLSPEGSLSQRDTASRKQAVGLATSLTGRTGRTGKLVRRIRNAITSQSGP